MERSQAVALIKEVVANNLAEPYIMTLERRERQKYSIVLKGQSNFELLKQFVAKKNLAIEENKENGYCVIYEP